MVCITYLSFFSHSNFFFLLRKKKKIKNIVLQKKIVLHSTSFWNELNYLLKYMNAVAFSPYAILLCWYHIWSSSEQNQLSMANSNLL